MELAQATEDAAAGVSEFVMRSADGSMQQGRSASESPLHRAAAAARKAGFEEGLARGQEEGREAAAKEHQVQLVRLQANVGQLFAYRSAIRTEVEGEVVDLAFAVARRILRRESTLDRSAAAGIVRSCMDEKSKSEVSRVLVHPDDLEQVKLCVGPEVEVAPSKDVTRGGAILETSHGLLDARIDSQLDELQMGLADA
jgi:flagellar assembly protein FliH